MSNFSKHDVVLIRYPFSNQSGSKVRPAVVVSEPHPSSDILVVPLTSRLVSLLPGEFILGDWPGAGLNVATAVKRGVYTVHESLVMRRIGRLAPADSDQMDRSLHAWLGFPQRSGTS
jgi:mRNA interferase MazF